MQTRSWKTRFVEDALPLCTSLATHGVLVAVVVLALKTLVAPARPPASESQAFSPETGMFTGDLPPAPNFAFTPPDTTEAATQISDSMTPVERFTPEDGATLEPADIGTRGVTSAAPNLIGLPRFAPGDDGGNGTDKRSGSP